MRFQVPQFIETEDKIVGPLTLKQFLWIAGVFCALVGLWFVLKLWALVLAAIPMLSFVALIVFYKPRGKNFLIFLMDWFKYISSPKLYLWKK